MIHDTSGSRDVRLAEVPESDASRLLELWEASVRASHRFLTEADIVALRPLIVDAVFGLDHLVGGYDGAGMLVGFVATAGDRMEAMFVDPAWFGQGVGRVLAEHAIRELGIRAVDVNEQNPGALGFYQHLGFTVVDRSPLDHGGRPFPLLHLRLGSSQGVSTEAPR